MKTEKHKEALAALRGHIPTPAHVSTPAPPASYAELPSARHLDQFLAQETFTPLELEAVDDPLEDVVMDDVTGLYSDRAGNHFMFSAGEQETLKERQKTQAFERKLDDLAYLTSHSLFGHSDSTNVEPNDTIEPLDSLDELDEREDEEQTYVNSSSPPSQLDECLWFSPSFNGRTLINLKSKMFMLDLLDNLPRLRLSDDHMKAIIWVMRECGTPDVPSFTALRKTQANLVESIGPHSNHHVSPLGNHFFMNHPMRLFAMDWANPLVRKHIHIYPELSPIISETWQAQKWLHEVDPSELPPMWADWNSAQNRHRHFYVNELARTQTGEFVIILRWVIIAMTSDREGSQVHADILRVTVQETSGSGLFCTIHSQHDRIPAQSLAQNILEIQATYGEDYSPRQYTVVNPLREISKGRPMFRLRVIPWSDDVSGNVSKQYNAHTNVYITNAHLPHRMLAQEFFIRYCSTSQVASSSEQFVALCEDFKCNKWTETYDCELDEEILFQLIPHFLPADNPQQSETASHIGVNGSKNCRRDLNGGSEAFKETVDGYEALYHPGSPRNTEQTIQCIRWQIWQACYGKEDAVKESATATGVKDKISQYWIDQLLIKFKEHYKERIKNPDTRDPRLNSKSLKGDGRKLLVEEISRKIQLELWNWVIQQPQGSYEKLAINDRIDPHLDTPGELLHSWLLGPDKYVWHSTSQGWNSDYESIFAVRLQSSCLDGLTIPPPRAEYMMKYKNSLIGKHFKSLQQLAVFHLHGLCSNQLFNLWKATGELGAYLWMPEIRNLDIYLADLQILIDNLLDAWADVDSRRIITKIKLHVLTHLPEDILFRLCSILSNHLAPSRDIALALGGMERFKHIISGGYWRDVKTNRYICAGVAIREFFKKNQHVQRQLGWADDSKITPGQIKLDLNLVAGDSISPSAESVWNPCMLVVSRSKDICRVGAWVCLEYKNNITAARIVKILIENGKSAAPSNVRILLEHFRILDRKDERLNMPILVNSTEIIVASGSDILFDFNPQHDCVSTGCQIGVSDAYVMQERMQTTKHKACIAHVDDERYLLNMHALHNAHLIREALPRHLVAPVPLKSDRIEFHKQLSASLQVSGVEKRALTRTKAAETRERNKKAKEAAGS
ncbi:hypothetical protein K435DRAFT_892109 [Dendrothele bispora CBS 962.96]|uniref:Uncharacterized protein n=1 Tax=Dendrothele bispora (strain CBS 962.96) TaxID=1314807 RepID=A0A4S8MR31_DENBC|nr:hypothetical protein K435DRAFT_892109 [Dendrothele bispora CBS 962.96]